MITSCFVLLFGLLSLPAKCQNMMRGPSTKESRINLPRDTAQDGWLLSVYLKYISPIDGDRCPMYPSCSQYTSTVFARHGTLLGFVLTTERLTRCGNDLWNYPHVVQNGRDYFIDMPR